MSRKVPVRGVEQVKDALGVLGSAMKVSSTLLHYGNEVKEALLLQAIARAQGEENLLILKELAENGIFSDPAALEGIEDAVVTFLMTDWDDYRSCGPSTLLKGAKNRTLIDARRMFSSQDAPPDIRVLSLGSFDRGPH